MVNEKVVPGVIVAPPPVTVVWKSPRLAKVKGLAFTVLLVIPVNEIVVKLTPEPNVMLLPMPLNDPVVEYVTGVAFVTFCPAAKIAMSATPNASGLSNELKPLMINPFASVDPFSELNQFQTDHRAGRLFDQLMAA